MRLVEVYVRLFLHGHEVDVCVAHFETDDTLSHLFTWDGLLDGHSHLLGKDLQAGQLLVGEVEDIVHLALRDHQSVALGQRADVQEGIVMLVLCNLVAGNLSCYDFTENTCHDV